MASSSSPLRTAASAAVVEEDDDNGGGGNETVAVAFVSAFDGGERLLPCSMRAAVAIQDDVEDDAGGEVEAAPPTSAASLVPPSPSPFVVAVTSFSFPNISFPHVLIVSTPFSDFSRQSCAVASKWLVKPDTAPNDRAGAAVAADGVVVVLVASSSNGKKGTVPSGPMKNIHDDEDEGGDEEEAEGAAAATGTVGGRARRRSPGPAPVERGITFPFHTFPPVGSSVASSCVVFLSLAADVTVPETMGTLFRTVWAALPPRSSAPPSLPSRTAMADGS